jgi:hypothetical protein
MIDMGTDIHGLSPNSEIGEHFANDCWTWRPLWDYVCHVCSDIITEDEHSKGNQSAGCQIDGARAMKIALRLDHLLEQKETQAYDAAFKNWKEHLPLVECRLCHGTGKRTDMEVAGGCNSCTGKGRVRDRACSYPFSADNVKEFAEFCRHSGGFAIY